MVLEGNYLQRIFLSTVSGNSSNYFANSTIQQHMPMLNSLSNSLSGYLSAHNQISKKKALMSWYKSMPELMGFINKVAGDMVGRFHFETVVPSDSGRNKILKANTFAQEVVLTQTMEEQAVDMLGLGEAFGWLGKISNTKLKDAIKDKLKEKSLSAIERKEYTDKMFLDMMIDIKQTDLLSNTNHIDEDLLKPRKYRVIASSTMEVIHNDFDILKYHQVVGVNTIPFNTNEIVHYTLMRRDGKPTGFSCVEGVITQLELLRQMWQNMVSVHKNGGAMDKIVSFENERPNSPTFERTKEQFLKYKQVENRHGLYLTTGKLNVQDLQSINDMQFETMGLYVTGILALQWGIPRSSIPFIQSGVNTKDDTGGNTERGYWEVIRRFQKLFADTMNTQLWIPYFGVRIVLENPYFQLDVQEQTFKQTLYNNVKLLDDIARINKKRFKFNEKLKLLGLDTDMFEDIPEDDLMIQQPTGTMNDQLSKSDINDTDEKKNKNAKKKDEQTATIQSAGKPTGVGKEIYYGSWNDEVDKNLLETKEMESEIVSLQRFIELYTADKSLNQEPPRLFLRRNSEMTTFFFKSTDFTFKTVMSNEEFENNRISILNLTDGKVWRV